MLHNRALIAVSDLQIDPSHHATTVGSHHRIYLQIEWELVPLRSRLNSSAASTSPGSHKPAQAHCSWVTLPLHQERALWVAREQLLSTSNSHQNSFYCPAWWACWYHRIEKETAKRNGRKLKSSPEIRTWHHFLKWIIFPSFISKMASLKRVMTTSAKAKSTIWFQFFLFSPFFSRMGIYGLQKLVACKLRHL